MFHYFLFHKPYNVLSQFSAEGDKKTLADFFPGLAKNIYPVGRLDYDSEGLLLFSDDKAMTHKLLEPSFAHPRTYLVQVDGEINEAALNNLETGVTINVNGKQYRTRSAVVKIISDLPGIEERDPPVRFRKSIPTSWISLTLTEGKNRQVRRMTAAVGYPTLRLIRYAIGGITIEGIEPGGYRMLDEYDMELLLSKK
jgi:23S rRNA pseudouridine2457 synthase